MTGLRMDEHNSRYPICFRQWIEPEEDMGLSTPLVPEVNMTLRLLASELFGRLEDSVIGRCNNIGSFSARVTLWRLVPLKHGLVGSAVMGRLGRLDKSGLDCLRPSSDFLRILKSTHKWRTSLTHEVLLLCTLCSTNYFFKKAELLSFFLRKLVLPKWIKMWCSLLSKVLKIFGCCQNSY